MNHLEKTSPLHTQESAVRAEELSLLDAEILDVSKKINETNNLIALLRDMPGTARTLRNINIEQTTLNTLIAKKADLLDKKFSVQESKVVEEEGDAYDEALRQTNDGLANLRILRKL